ncbi:hypothetical protein Tco_1515324 [Tanacetum coccineum]
MSSKVAENMSTHAEQAQTDLLPNNATITTSSDAWQSKTHLFLSELTDGVTRTIIVIVCRIWDVHAITGHYLSTDFIVSDSQGNKDEYRIFRDHAFILEFDGATSVRTTSGKDGGFVRYPFQLQEIGNIELTHNKYLIGPLTRELALGLWTSTSLMARGEGEGSLNQVAAHVDYSQPKDGTLENLLIWARNQKNDVRLFLFTVKLL